MSWYPEDDPRNKPYAMDWNFTPEGRKLGLERYYLAPEKIELLEGGLFGFAEARLVMLGLLIENVGVDAVVRLGDPAVWKAAVANL